MISVFLSSTFQDMQRERDLIHRYVLPKIQMYASKYHEIVNIVDLRWGIDTNQLSQQTAMDKVLLTCKRLVHECQPCFIALLGANYGTVLEEKYHKHYTFSQNLSNQQYISVTEFEVCSRLEYTDEICFMLRTDIPTIEERQQLFCNAVAKKYPQHTIYYRLNDMKEIETGENNRPPYFAFDFITSVINYICQCIDRYVEKHPTHICYENYVKNSVACLPERTAYIEKLTTLLRSDARLILVHGITGIGKRTTLYQVLTRESYNIIGITSSTYLDGDILTAICRFLSEQIALLLPYSIEAADDNSAKRLERYLQEYSKYFESPLVIVLEQVEDWLGIDWIRCIFRLPLAIGTYVKWCATTTQNDKSWKIFQNDLYVVEFPLSFFSAAEKSAAITAMFQQVGKELSTENIDAICAKKKRISAILAFDQKPDASFR